MAVTTSHEFVVRVRARSRGRDPLAAVLAR